MGKGRAHCSVHLVHSFIRSRKYFLKCAHGPGADPGVGPGSTFVVLTASQEMVSPSVNVGMVITLSSGLQGGLDEIIHKKCSLAHHLATEKVSPECELLLLLTPWHDC